jgi:hypothetical protein
LPVISEKAARNALFPQSPFATNGSGQPSTLLYGILNNSVMRIITSLPAGLDTAPVSPDPPLGGSLPYKDVPVWVAIYTGLSIPSSGGVPIPGGTTTTERQSKPAQSVLYSFIDADTGQYLFAEAFGIRHNGRALSNVGSTWLDSLGLSF